MCETRNVHAVMCTQSEVNKLQRVCSRLCISRHNTSVVGLEYNTCEVRCSEQQMDGPGEEPRGF